MQADITSLQCVFPKNLHEALVFKQEHPQLKPMAGCTDLYVDLNFGQLRETEFLNLWGLEELRFVEEQNGELVLGALTTYTDIIQSPICQAWIPILGAASKEVGGVQIQNRGTLGGNVVNASPAGDTLPVLAIAEAHLVLSSANEQRRIPIQDFYTGYRSTVMRPDELLTAIAIPPLHGRQWFRKVGTRAAQAISKIVMAGLRGRDVRIALGSVAATVLRVPQTESVLMAEKPISMAQETLQSEIHPIDDLRSTGAYRRKVCANLLSRFWEQTSGISR